MKTCPTCNRTFEDTFTFCLADGSLLNAPFNPQATLVIPEPRETGRPPTEELERAEETWPGRREPVATPEPAQQQTEFETVEAGPPRRDATTRPARNWRRLSLMIGALAAVLIIGAAVFLLGNRNDSTRQNPINANAATVNAATPDSANTTNSVNSEAASDEETTSSDEPITTTESAGGEPLPGPSRPSTKKVPRVQPTVAQSSRKETATEAKPTAKPTRPAASASPCANKSYPVCEPGERLVCIAATGSWQCRRSRR